jgi:hypothetical protein
VCGAIGVIYLTATEIAYLVNDKYLVNSPSGLAIIGGMILIAVIIYTVAQFVQRRRGVDFAMLAQEIPPE